MDSGTSDIYDPQQTPFVGRNTEIEQITSQMIDPACRLLTIVGAGGVGKTRLALHLIDSLRDRFADGIYVIDLQTSKTADDLIAEIVNSTRIALSGEEAPAEQLQRFLEDKQMLLVLDNFEQVLESGYLLAHILRHAPSVKLLVTSREALNLSEEHRYNLRGLEPPQNHRWHNLTANDSVRLFVERARRVRKDFLLEDEWEDVIRICQLVEGIPLALEMASVWVNALTCATIASEIQHNLNFLQSRLRDVPERHRSMEAIFEQSWQRLSEDERRVFMLLSVFQGGFGREAAQAVAGLSNPMLSALLDQSLLHFEQPKHYRIHELLRQYAQAKLEQSTSETINSVRKLHAAYYMRFLAERCTDVTGGRQREAAGEIASELDNVRAAWTWAVTHRQIDAMVDAVFTLFSVYQFRSRYLEAARMLEPTVQCLDEPTLFLHPRAMLILTCLGWFYIRLGRFEEAESVFLRASAVFPRLDIRADMPYAFDPSVGLSLLAFMRGDYADAQRLLDQALLTSEPVRHLVNLESAYYVLAGLQFAQGQYHKAQQSAQAGYGAAQALQSRWFMAYCLNELGKATAALGDCASAAKHYEASYALRDEFDDAEGMAVALRALGELAFQQHDYERAERLLAESLSLYRGINDKGGRATVLHELGRTAIARNAIGKAAEYLRQALDTASDIPFVSLELNIMTSVAELLLTQGDLETANWLNFIYMDQGTEPQLRERVVQLRSQFDIDKGSANRIQAESSRSLNTIVAEVQTRMALFSEVLHRELGNEHHPTSVTESFTVQEGKILRLLAQGLSNAEIAQELTVVVGTVKTHNHHIYAKLGVRNRTQAILRAREMHLI